jgi:adenylate kinase family enzyme
MDLRLKNDSVFQIVGPSGSGKTLFVSKLLAPNKDFFIRRIKNIYWLRGVSDNEGEKGDTSQSLKHLKNVKFLNGFEKGWMELPQTDDVIVIDDLFAEANKEDNFNNLFTKIARHRGVTVIFITQNMFHQGGQHRTRNLNVHYLVLFKNPRDCSAINFIARQAYPNNSKFLIDAYNDATRYKPHAYLFIDFTQQCPEDLRVRTNIFDEHMIVYKLNDDEQ